MRINDGLTRNERHAKKKGRKKKGTEEWLEMIRARTKEGMARPDIRAKLSKPRRPKSLERRIAHSDLLKGRMPKNILNGNRKFGNVQRGHYDCSKGEMFFRSKWEANYALYLDFLVKQGEIKNWMYEEDTFMFERIKLGTRSYTPDFKIFNNDETVEYHEVKGYMDQRSKTKLKRMYIYYPEIVIILVDRSFYSEIVKKFKGIIEFY